MALERQFNSEIILRQTDLSTSPALDITELLCTLINGIALCNTVLHYTLIYCTVLHCIALYCIALHCITLHLVAAHDHTSVCTSALQWLAVEWRGVGRVFIFRREHHLTVYLLLSPAPPAPPSPPHHPTQDEKKSRYFLDFWKLLNVSTGN